MTTRPDTFPDFWPVEVEAPEGRARERAAAGPSPTPAMRKAERTTEVAREAIDAETARRVAQVARLKAARLARDADPPADAPAAEPAPKAAKPARKSRAKAPPAAGA